MNNKSPWNAYGRAAKKPAIAPFEGKFDPTFGAAKDAMQSHEHLHRYLTRTLQEFDEIRAGRTGYARIVSDALKPAIGPESIEETLLRLSRGPGN